MIGQHFAQAEVRLQNRRDEQRWRRPESEVQKLIKYQAAISSDPTTIVYG